MINIHIVQMESSHSLQYHFKIEWKGRSQDKQDLELPPAEVCLNTADNIQTITQIHGNSSISHFPANLIDDSLCIEAEDIFGTFILGPQKLIPNVQDIVNTTIAYSPKIDVEPLEKNSILSVYSTSNCSSD